MYSSISTILYFIIIIAWTEKEREKEIHYAQYYYDHPLDSHCKLSFYD